MELTNEEKRVWLQVKDLFIKKGAFADENVRAAAITAASKMALAGDEILLREADVIDALKNGLTEEGMAKIGMGPQYVQNIIGYSVDFNDFGNASAAYNAQKEQYDNLYHNIMALNMQKSQNKEM